MLTPDDELAIDIILRAAVHLLNAQHASIYSVDDRLHCFIVKNSSWRKIKEKAAFQNVIGATHIFQTLKPFSIQSIRSFILDFSDSLANAYMDVDLNCCLSYPIMAGTKVVGIIEIIDKRSGSPIFDAEDEFILKQLAAMCTIVMTHNEIREESRRRGDDIQAVLKTASLMSSEVELAGTPPHTHT
jgi:transcriptional regulator with GAF, ATPase, and Fis domain